MPVIGLFICTMVALLLTVLPASLAASEIASASAIARGRAFAQLNCSRCHAIGLRGSSPNPKAPRFRAINRNYPYRILLEGLQKGMAVSHDPRSMPAFFLPRQTAQDIVTYMQSLRKR